MPPPAPQTVPTLHKTKCKAADRRWSSRRFGIPVNARIRLRLLGACKCVGYREIRIGWKGRLTAQAGQHRSVTDAADQNRINRH